MERSIHKLRLYSYRTVFGFSNNVCEFLKDQQELFAKNKSIALSWAAKNGYAEIVKILLSSQTPISDVRAKDGQPLFWACTGGHLAVVKLLLKHANTAEVNECDSSGHSILSLAVAGGHFEITRLVMSRKDVDINKADRSGWSPLFWTIENEPSRKYIRLLSYLISDPRVRLAQRDRYGRTVLSWAAERGNGEAIKALLQQNHPDIQELLDDTGDSCHGWSPLSYAAFHGQHEAVKLLCQTGKIDSQLASVDRGGQNAISLAADRNHPEIIRLLAQYYPEGMDVPEECGRTPLSCAMWGSTSNSETVRALLQTGLVDVNHRANIGYTALAYAVGAGRPDLVRILVEEGGADMEIVDNEGMRPGDGADLDWRTPLAREELERLREKRARQTEMKAEIDIEIEMDAKDEDDSSED